MRYIECPVRTDDGWVELFGAGDVVLSRGSVAGGQNYVLRWLRDTFQLRDNLL
jgi:hypothetical protein